MIVTARPCDANGAFLDDPDSAPPPPETHHDCGPFGNRVRFEFANLLFQKMATSKGDINQLLQILHAKDILDGHEDSKPLFHSADDMAETIDAYPGGGTNWYTFGLR